MNIRIGFGYDVHRLAEGRELWIGGIRLDHDRGLLGHSDADVLLHAICDALLGAAGLRDIGFHFSDKDPRWKGIDSKLLLAESWKKVQEQGYVLGNIDCTLVAEAPRINPHVPAMQEVIAGILGTETGNVSIKATTHEKMDAAGREEGMYAYAVALIMKP